MTADICGFFVESTFSPSLQNVLLFVNEGIVRVGENVYFSYNESIYNCSSKKKYCSCGIFHEIL